MALERTLVQIRERRLDDLLDLSLVVVRKRPLTLGLAALLGIAPFAALNAWIFSRFQSEDGARSFYALTLWMIEAPLATAPITVALGGMMFGQKLSPPKVFGSLWRATFPLLVVHGVLRFVLFFWIPTRLAFANEILLLERGKWWKITERGGDLSSGRSNELVLLGLLQIVLTVVFIALFYEGLSRIGQAIMAENMTWHFPDVTTYTNWLIQLPIWLAVSFFAVARFLAYIDQRIRLEGWEVELRLREVGEAMEEAQRW